MKYLTAFAAGVCLLAIQNSGTDAGDATSATGFEHSIVSIAAPSAHLLVCPQGDGQSLADVGATISVQAIICCDFPAEGALPQDFWLIGSNGGIVLCPPEDSSSNADSSTNANGMTTMSGTIKAGGSDSGLWVMVLGWVAQGSTGAPITLPITVVSPDIDGDLDVDLVDLSLFAGTWPPQPYSSAGDFNGDGVVNLPDLSLFAQHFLHAC